MQHNNMTRYIEVYKERQQRNSDPDETREIRLHSALVGFSSHHFALESRPLQNFEKTSSANSTERERALPQTLNPRERKRDASRDNNDTGGAMRESNRNGVLEAAMP